MDSRIKQIVTEMYGKSPNDVIAETLNKQGLKSLQKKKFTGSLVSAYAIKMFGLPRLRNSSAGPAGSTGVAPKRTTRRTRRSSLNDIYEKVEDIMTCNLDTDTKVKLIALIAGK